MTDIAQRLGCDRKTVRKSLVHPDQPRYTARPPRPSKLDPLQSSVQQRLERGVCNGEVLSRELSARGYTGKKTLLRASVQPRRRAARHQACVRCETPPGQQGQVDWGHFGTMWHEGRQRRLSCCALTLGYSRALYAECTVSSGMMACLRCPMHALTELGGVPEHLLQDQQTTVGHTHDPGGAHCWNARSLDCADHYGVVPRWCRPYRAQTKGKGESGMKYLRRNFWPSCPDVATLEGLHAALKYWLADVAHGRVHGTTHAVPKVRLAGEQLRPVTRVPYDLSMVSTRRRSQDGFISDGGNRSAVPAGQALSQLTVRETPAGC
jgi:transposase